MAIENDFTDDSGAALPEPEELEDQDLGSEDPTPIPEPKTVAEKVEAQGRPPRRPGDTRRGRREAFAKSNEKLKNELATGFKAELKQMEDRFAAQLQAARQAAAPQSQQGQQQAPQGDQFDAKLKEVGTSMQREMALFQAHRANPNAKGDFDLSRYNELRQQEIQIHAQRMAFQTMREMGLTPELLKRLQSEQPRQAYDRESQNQFRFNQLQSEFPHIKGDAWAVVGNYRRYLLSIGREDTLDTDREAAAHVASERGLYPQQRPRPNEQRYTGVRSDNRGGPSGGQELRLPRAAVAGLSEQERRLAALAVRSGDE